MSTSSLRQHQHEAGMRSRRHTRRHPAASPTHLCELGTDIVATRLRTLGHPTRLRLMRALDGRPATADQLAESLGEQAGAIRAHLSVLYRAGVVRRVDEEGGGRPAYELADWPSLWLVEQLAYRLRLRAIEDGDLGPDQGDEGSPVCR
jgi:DNA-binding transcriptional ArsR family regulator